MERNLVAARSRGPFVPQNRRPARRQVPVDQHRHTDETKLLLLQGFLPVLPNDRET